MYTGQWYEIHLNPCMQEPVLKDRTHYRVSDLCVCTFTHYSLTVCVCVCVCVAIFLVCVSSGEFEALVCRESSHSVGQAALTLENMANCCW